MGRVFRSHRRQILGMVIVSMCGCGFLGSYSLRCRSTDCFFRLRSLIINDQRAATEPARIVFVDVNTITNPGPYVLLLNELSNRKAKAVVFDIVFTNQFWDVDKATNEFVDAFRRATSRGVKVVFAAQGGEVYSGEVIRETGPAAWIMDMVESNPESAIGLSDLAEQRSDGVVRRYSLSSKHVHDPLAVVTASLLHQFPGDRTTHWINYYGPPGTIRAVNLHDLTGSNAGSPVLFNDKVVFVGQGPPASDQRSELDQHRTPFTTSTKRRSTGVEIHATAFCNLIHGDWLKAQHDLLDWAIVLAVGILSGIYFTKRPLRKVFLGAIATAMVAFVSSFLAFTYGVYLIPWAVIAVPQMAAAIAVAFLPLKTAFVSYRRVDGRNVAVFITSELNHLGIEAFMDIKEHTAGRLDTILFAQIAHRENFILILTPGLIERWRPGEGAENDWIGQEIERAVQLKKTVIPVPVDDFGRFLEQYRTLQNKAVPAGVQTVFATYKRSSYSSDQPDASVEAIARNLKSGFRRF